MKIHTLNDKSKPEPVFKHRSIKAYDPRKTSLKSPATHRLEENHFPCIQRSSSELQPFGSESAKPQKDGNQPCQHLPRLQSRSSILHPAKKSVVKGSVTAWSKVILTSCFQPKPTTSEAQQAPACLGSEAT